MKSPPSPPNIDAFCSNLACHHPNCPPNCTNIWDEFLCFDPSCIEQSNKNDIVCRDPECQDEICIGAFMDQSCKLCFPTSSLSAFELSQSNFVDSAWPYEPSPTSSSSMTMAIRDVSSQAEQKSNGASSFSSTVRCPWANCTENNICPAFLIHHINTKHIQSQSKSASHSFTSCPLVPLLSCHIHSCLNSDASQKRYTPELLLNHVITDHFADIGFTCFWQLDNPSHGICGQQCISANELHQHVRVHHLVSIKTLLQCLWQGCLHVGSFESIHKCMRHLQSHTGKLFILLMLLMMMV